MKNLFFTGLLLLIGTGSYAQARDILPRSVPPNVKSAFTQQFAQASDVEWEEQNGNYRVSFEIGTVDHEAAFTSAGKLLSHTYDIARSDVPASVKTAFAGKFKNAADIEWEKQNDDFKVSFEIGRTDHEAVFTPRGELIKHARDITQKELPAAVSSKLQQDYSSYRIDDITEIKEGKEVSYKIDLDGQPDLTLRYDEKGHVLLKIVDR